MAEVENYEKELKPIFEGDYFKIALLGIGPDSHTAGILPNENKDEFDKTFLSENLVVGYVNNGQFKERITLTPKALEKMDSIIAYAVGENKHEALNNLKTKNLTHLYPATLLGKLQNVEIFTDQNI